MTARAARSDFRWNISFFRNGATTRKAGYAKSEAHARRYVQRWRSHAEAICATQFSFEIAPHSAASIDLSTASAVSHPHRRSDRMNAVHHHTEAGVATDAAPATRYYKLGANGERLPADAKTFEAVEDTKTGLIWSHTLSRRANEERALAVIAECRSANASDWRLPTLDESETILDRTRFAPAIDTDYFPDTQNGWYRTSSVCAGDPSCAWVVYGYGGSVNWLHRDDEFCVRAVRSVAPAAGQ